MGMPGYGDEATWPACTGHPNDPRTEQDEPDFGYLNTEERKAFLRDMSKNDLIDFALQLGDMVDDLERQIARAEQIAKRKPGVFA